DPGAQIELTERLRVERNVAVEAVQIFGAREPVARQNRFDTETNLHAVDVLREGLRNEIVGELEPAPRPAPCPEQQRRGCQQISEPTADRGRPAETDVVRRPEEVLAMADVLPAEIAFDAGEPPRRQHHVVAAEGAAGEAAAAQPDETIGKAEVW